MKKVKWEKDSGSDNDGTSEFASLALSSFSRLFDCCCFAQKGRYRCLQNQFSPIRSGLDFIPMLDSVTGSLVASIGDYFATQALSQKSGHDLAPQYGHFSPSSSRFKPIQGSNESFFTDRVESAILCVFGPSFVCRKSAQIW